MLYNHPADPPQLRHRCRNPRCGGLLKNPTDDRRAAFCCEHCERAHFATRCIVCEAAIAKASRRRTVCWRSKCRHALQRHPGKYRLRVGQNAAKTVTAHPRRSHRVRDEFPGEFKRASGGPVDFVVVRQIKPGQRIRAPFTLVEGGADALGMMQPLAMRGLNDDEAAAHTLFDLTQAGGRPIPTVELAELIARYAIAPVG